MENNQNRQKMCVISQIGMVVPNLEKAIDAMKRVFDAEPDKFMGASPNAKFYYGQQVDSETRIALYHFANLELEFIEPVSGQGVWHDFLRDKGPGVHHLKFSVADLDGAKDGILKAGYHESMNGDSAFKEGLKWSYFDTDVDLGFALELFNDLDL